MPADDTPLTWTIADTPLEDTVAPPARRSWRVWFLTGGIAAGALIALWLGTLGQDLGRRWEAERAAVREEQAAFAQDLSTLRALSDPAGGVWLEERLQAVAAGWPAPTPLGYLHGTGAPGQVLTVTVLAPDLARVEMVRVFQDPAGAFYPFALPQFYRKTAAGWQRVPAPAGVWGGLVVLTGRRLVISVPPVDEAWARGLLPDLDDLLDRFCAQMSCPAAPIALVFGHDTFPRLEQPELQAGDPLLLGLLPPVVSRVPQAALLVPTPSDVGYPLDAAGRDLLRRAVGMQVLYTAVDRAVYGADNLIEVPNLFFFALVARLGMRYGVEPAGRRVAPLPLEQAPALNTLWDIRFPAWQRPDLIRHALALLNYWLADEPPGTDLRLLRLIGSAHSLNEWWTAGAAPAP